MFTELIYGTHILGDINREYLMLRTRINVISRLMSGRSLQDQLSTMRTL
jgi:hypothetical protein